MLICLSLTFCSLATAAQAAAPVCFDTKDAEMPDADVPVVAPWRTIPLDPDYGGLWAVAGDVDGDGEAEIVSAENSNADDTHCTSAVAAQKLDGRVLWRWGDPAIGRKNWHHDVACQIHDWDRDGKNEVVLLALDALVELEGATGAERRRWPIEPGASDCLVFCDLSGKGYPTDVLVKDRYTRIWAFDHDGKPLWNVENPGGYRTAHQPFPVDIDGDGRDEIVAGYAMLNPDGSVRWTLKSETVALGRGHLDCCRVLEPGTTPETFRLALTCCGDNALVVVDGNGKVQWETTGYHFESITIGRIVPDRLQPQILVDIDHLPVGEGPLWVFGPDGTWLGRILTSYARHHRLLDWDGDGYDEMLVAESQRLYDGHGRPVARLAVPESKHTQFEKSALVGDMTGDGIPDILFITPDTACIFRNEHGAKPAGDGKIGTGLNVTLY